MYSDLPIDVRGVPSRFATPQAGREAGREVAHSTYELLLYMGMLIRRVRYLPALRSPRRSIKVLDKILNNERTLGLHRSLFSTEWCE